MTGSLRGEFERQGFAVASPVRDLSAMQRDGRPLEAAGDALFIIGDAPLFDPVFARLAIQPELIAAAQALLGTNDIRFHLSNVTMKRPGIGSRIAWHRDFPNRYICPANPSFLRVMLCLDGMDAGNGGTAFLSGSHLRLGEVPSVEELVGAATADCAPGALVFIHPCVLHGSRGNVSPRQRRNLIIQWARADDPPQLAAGISESLTNLSVFALEKLMASCPTDRWQDLFYDLSILIYLKGK